MKYLLVTIFMLTGCSIGKYHRVVEPLEALQLCGKTGVTEYAAMSGHVSCNKEKVK